VEKWLLEQSAVVVMCGVILFCFSKAITAIYRDWMGKDSFAKGFFEQHARIADAVVEMKDEMASVRVEMKDQMTGVHKELCQVKEGLTSLTHEVKHHPPTRLRERA
jgi:hypothetical protein